MTKKELGMTLVEVLVTLVLVTLVGALIWTTVSISMKHNITETKKLRLQQEMNYIITKIQQEHRHRECYEVSLNENEISIGNCEEGSSDDEVISTGFLYSYSSVSPLPKSANTIQVKPKSQDLKVENFTISDSEKKKLKVTVEMLISRYKTE